MGSREIDRLRALLRNFERKADQGSKKARGAGSPEARNVAASKINDLQELARSGLRTWIGPMAWQPAVRVASDGRLDSTRSLKERARRERRRLRCIRGQHYAFQRDTEMFGEVASNPVTNGRA